MQDERNVERANRGCVRPLAGKQIQKRRRVAHCRIGRERPAPVLKTAPRGDDRSNLRRQPDGFPVLRLRRRVGQI